MDANKKSKGSNLTSVEVLDMINIFNQTKHNGDLHQLSQSPTNVLSALEITRKYLKDDIIEMLMQHDNTLRKKTLDKIKKIPKVDGEVNLVSMLVALLWNSNNPEAQLQII